METKPTHPHEKWDPDNYEQCKLLKIYPDSGGAFMWQADVCINLGDWEDGHEDLATRFAAWADEFPDHPDDPAPDPDEPKWRDWKHRGFKLAQEVRKIVPDVYTVFYYPFANETYEICNT